MVRRARAGRKNAHARRHRARADSRNVRDCGRGARRGHRRSDGRRGNRNSLRDAAICCSNRRGSIRFPFAARRRRSACARKPRMRFERGADPEMAELASRRCAELIQQIGGGEMLAGVVDVYPGRTRAAGDRADAQGTSARDGRGRARRGDRSDSRRAWFCAACAWTPARRSCGIIDGGVDVPPPVVARRRHARNGLDRRSRAALRRRQISRAAARGEAARRAPANMPKPRIACASD